MPKGIYKRVMTPKRKAMIEANFAKGRTPEVRAAVAIKLKQNVTEEWRRKVGEATKAAMHRPEIRERHLLGLAKAFAIHGSNFKGGNGQPPTEIIKKIAFILVPLGFVMEYPIKTKGHNTGLKAATAYKVDFAHPVAKIAIEVDGPYHLKSSARARDEKKTAVLEALGWKVLRISHQ